MLYFIKVYGCQMNYSDAERISSVLENTGYIKTEKESDADIIVFVACSVRESAVNRLYGNGKKFKKYRKKKPELKTVITGCLLEEDKERLGGIFDIIINIKEISDLPNKIGSPKSKEYSDYFQIKPSRETPFTAYVPIMTGCNNFCSYCVVPYTRGREYSRPVEDVIGEISELIKEGYEEIILLGQNVNSYSPDKNTDFPALIEKINDLKGDFWIRFLTSHPKDMTEKLIKTISKCEKCTNYIHLALQSGDDLILERMNRKYTKDHFLSLVEMIRKNFETVTLTTDIIVGFPGETEEQFEHTAEIMRLAKFDMAYINKYSPRRGTVSYQMKDDVTWEEKKNRENRLNEVLKTTTLENNKRYLEKETEILLEKENNKFYFGKTRSFKDIKISKNSQKIELGKFYTAKIKKVTPWALEGEIIENNEK